MRAVLAGLLAAGACSLAAAPAASASPVAPRSAAAFYDSVGVSTHIVYYDTAYGDWSRIVARLQELGVRHIRDGIYANPTGQGAGLKRALLRRRRVGRLSRDALHLRGE